MTKFIDEFSTEIWASTYKDYKDNNVDDTFRRVAKALASVESTSELKKEWEEKFFDLMSDFKGGPGGRTYANAGTEWSGTTLLNCFVSPRDKENIDSLNGIIKDLNNQAATLKAEGGWGQNFCFGINELLYIVREEHEVLEKIGNVKKGDYVYSDNNRLHKVEAVLESYKDNMIRLTLENGKEIVCTDDHPFLVTRDNEQQWVLAKDILDTDDLVCLSE